MAATQSDVGRWFDEGVKNKQDFMIVACDTFDWEDYPVFTTEANFAAKYLEQKNASMTKIMEVYNLSRDKMGQLTQYRCFNYPDNFDKSFA